MLSSSGFEYGIPGLTKHDNNYCDFEVSFLKFFPKLFDCICQKMVASFAFLQQIKLFISLRQAQSNHSKLFNHPEEDDRFDDFNGSVNGSVKTSNESSVKQLNGSLKEMFSRSENGAREEQINQRNARKSQVSFVVVSAKLFFGAYVQSYYINLVHDKISTLDWIYRF